MKKVLFALSIMVMVGLQVIAQTINVTGTVTDAGDGFPIPGVSVFVKGTTIGTVTTPDGTYNLTVPNDATTIVFSFVGMTTQEIAFTGQTTIDVALESDAVDVDEVVVTAIGITRQEKSLGYAVSKVDGEALTKAKDPNIINSLAGKVSGVRITQQSGSVGGSSKMIIRGATSLGGNNQPLFVVDGMPINNEYNDNGIAGAVDYGNAAADLNSMDVESVNVLKGAAATALYGARAKNGAVIITTKRGKKGKVNISYSTSIRFDEIAKLPDYQNEYAQGLDGVYAVKNLNGWGPRISDVQDQKFEDFTGEEITLQAHPDNVRDFFETGHTYIHNFDLNGGDENGDFRISYTNTTVAGVVPQSEYKKNDITFNTGRKLNEWLSVRANGTYTRGIRDGLSAQGSNDPNVVVSDILTMPRTGDIQKIRANTYDEFGNQIPWDGAANSKVNNPYYILDNNKISSDNERFFGSGVITIKPVDWLTIKNQTGIDFSTEDRRTIYSVGTLGEAQGRFIDHARRTRVINNDFIVSAQKDINEDLGISGIVGHNAYQKEYDRKSNDAKELVAPGLYTYANAKVNSPTSYYEKERIHGIFGEVSLDYLDMLFLTVTGRNDFSSTLPKANNSYFYPSVSFGYIFTKNLNLPSWMNFGKLRLNWANVGSDENPYQLDFEYDARSTWYSQYGSGGEFPHGGISGFTIPRVLPNADLKPQNQVSYEVGLDLRFLNSRITLDGTYYKIDTEDQIVAIDVPLSTGFFAKNINAGLVRNEGIEIELGLVPIKTSNVIWNANFVFGTNKNTVETLAPGLEVYQLTSGWSGLQIQAEVGESFGIYGTGWKRNDDGEYIINADTGLKELDPGQRLGDVDPDFTLGIINTVEVGSFTFNAVLDWKQGGEMYSGTVASLRSSGLATETAANRDNPIIDKGVNEVVNGETVTYVPNETPVNSMQQYWGHQSATSNTEGNIFDATYMKLREVSLTYKLPTKFLPKGYIKGLTIGVEGRNLWNIIDNVPHIDPELNFFGPGAIGGGVEFSSIPMSRSYGFNLKLNF